MSRLTRSGARRPRRCRLMLVSALALAWTAACGSGDQPGATAPCAFSLTLTPGQLSLSKGQQGTVTASVNTCSTNRRVDWAVADTSVAGLSIVNDTTATFTAKKQGGTSVLASLRADPATIFPLLIQVQ